MSDQAGAVQVPTTRYSVPSVRIAINIFNYLKQSSCRRASLAEICKAIGVSKSSAFSVLKTLQEANFVRYDPARKTYALGLALMELGRIVEDDMDHVATARAIVRQLVVETQETCLIARWMDAKLIVLHCEEPLRDVRVTIAVGQQLRTYLGAFGKAYLAFQGDGYVRQVLGANGLPALTPNTITEMEIFLNELVRCRQSGYAESHDETRHGITGVAAPVFDQNDSVVLIIGFLGFSSWLPEETLHLKAALVRQAAWKISAALGSSRRPGEPVLSLQHPR